MITDAFDDGQRAGVAYAEAFPDDPAQEQLTAGRAVEDYVASDDVVLRDELGVVVRAHGEPPAGQSLADVVVGVANQAQSDPAR